MSSDATNCGTLGLDDFTVQAIHKSAKFIRLAPLCPRDPLRRSPSGLSDVCAL